MKNGGVTKNITTLNIDNDNFKVVDRVLIKCRDYQNQKIVIPNGVTELASYSVSCTRAEVIYIPMSVDIIRKSAFVLTMNVTELYIENPDIYLEVGSLDYMMNLKEVYIGGQRVEAVVTQEVDKNWLCLEKYVGEYKSYVVDKDITVIGREAFSNCKNLESVEIPESVKYIETRAFSGCTSLKEVKMTNSLKDISLWAFEGCSAVRELTLPENIMEQRLSGEAFKGWKRNQVIRASKHLKKLKFMQRWRKGCKAKIIYY